MCGESGAAAGTPAARPHYIADEGRHLFAWHHPARPAVRRGAAIVLCPPLGSDYVCVYRVWRIFAERLAAAGFDVLRFDYEGTGDSAGDPEEPGRLEAWIGNIERVVTEARELAGSNAVALVGLRIGATLALQAAVARCAVDRLVLWSPFRSGRAYVRELKAFSRLSRKDYVTETDEGADILAAGYILPGAVAQALEGWDLDALSNRPALDVLLIDRDDRSPDVAIGEHLESLGCRVSRVRPAGTAEMLERPAVSKVPDAALDAIANWLGEWPPRRGPSPQAEEPAEDSRKSACSPGYCERAVRFGPADRLFGILTMPKDMDTTAPAVILMNTGFEYRVGPHRLYVPLARELAVQGHVVFRYDLGGIGDSAPPPGSADNVPYPPHALQDAREAVAFIRRQAPGRRLLMAGLCSGGWHAFSAAREGLEVDGIVSINAPLYLRDGLPRITRRSVEYQELQTYRRKLRERDRWGNIFPGGSAYLHFARLVTTYLGRKVTDRVAPALAGRLMDGLARDLDGISARGVTSLFVFSRGDSGLEYFQRFARGAFRRRTARERIRCVVVDGAGHTFSPPEAQRVLRQLLVDFVVSETPNDSAQRVSREAATLANSIKASL